MGNFHAAGLLLELGADVNFHETSAINEWTAPVLHDVIRAAMFTRERDAGLGMLKRLLELGADPNAADSYGNRPLMRALLDARIQISVSPGFPERIDESEMRGRLQRIFAVLLAAGADPFLESSQRESPAAAFAHDPALARLLTEEPKQ